LDFGQSELWKEEAGMDVVSNQWEFLMFVDMQMASCLSTDSSANLRGTRSVLLSLFQSSDWPRSLQPWCVSNEVSPPDHFSIPLNQIHLP
jgi:hypothetical protein